jgi:hypothetical protein
MAKAQERVSSGPRSMRATRPHDRQVIGRLADLDQHIDRQGASPPHQRGVRVHQIGELLDHRRNIAAGVLLRLHHPRPR